MGKPMEAKGNASCLAVSAPRVSCVAISGDGRRVAIVSDYKASVWEIDSGKLVRAPIPETGAQSVALSGVGRRLATASGGKCEGVVGR